MRAGCKIPLEDVATGEVVLVMPPLEVAGCHRESGLGDAAGRAGVATVKVGFVMLPQMRRA